jgi:hypothetical protein
MGVVKKYLSKEVEQKEQNMLSKRSGAPRRAEHVK